MFSSAMEISQQAAAIFLYVYIVGYFDFLFGSQNVALSNPLTNCHNIIVVGDKEAGC